MRSKISTVIVGFIVLFGVSFCSCVYAASKIIKVDANKMIISAQVIVEQGDVLTIDASGEWSTDGKEFFGPGGSSKTADATYQKSGVAVGCLLGRIGLKGPIFVVGAHFSQKVNEAGILWLGINDKKNLFEYGNNKGALNVNISIEKTAESVNGDYKVEYLENKMEIIVGKDRRPITLSDIPGKAFKVDGNEVILNRDMAGKIKDIFPQLVSIRTDGLAIYLDDANKPNDQPAKGLYNPRQRSFITGTGGSAPLGNSGAITLFFIGTSSGTFSSGAENISLKGNITMTIVGGSKDKAAGFTLVLPFEGQKLEK